MTRYILALLLLATSLPAQGIRVTAPASGGGPTTPGTTVVGQPVTWGDTAGGELLDSGNIHFPDGSVQSFGSTGDQFLYAESTGRLTSNGGVILDLDSGEVRSPNLISDYIYGGGDGSGFLGVGTKRFKVFYMFPRSTPHSTSSTPAGEFWRSNATPVTGTTVSANALPTRLHEWDDTMSQWMPLRSGGWVDVNETLTIGPAVGDWPDCTSGGADDKTAATAETDFSGLTGYSAGHRWVMVYGDHGIASATAYFRVKIPNTSITSASNENVPMWSYSNAATPGVTTIAGKFVASYPIKSDGTANIYCSQSSTLAGGDTMTILAFY